MNKADLIASVAGQAGLSKKDAGKAINATFEIIADTVAKNEKVRLGGFGHFETRERKERICLNPKTKEEIRYATTITPVFKAGKTLKDALSLESD